jgi:arginyl-tRNA synthetase
MKEFETVYKVLGVDFDYALGESFYSDLLPTVVEQVKGQPFVKETDGAVIADLGEELGKMVIQTKDGRSLYVTRDLATALFRKEVMGAERIIYVVGADQKHYFQQWFEILRKMGEPIADNCEHVYFGMISLPEGKMSTRKGRTVFLKDVIDEGIKRAAEVIREKNPALFEDRENMDKVTRQVAVGAIIWSDISKDMRRDITFNWDEMLSFDGYSAPYVQYAHARAQNILKKAQEKGIELNSSPEVIKITDPMEKELIKALAAFPQAVKLASTNTSPTAVAEYVYKLAQKFNTFYKGCPIVKKTSEPVDEVSRNTRLLLTEATGQVIKNSLYLLGIEAPEIM